MLEFIYKVTKFVANKIHSPTPSVERAMVEYDVIP